MLSNVRGSNFGDESKDFCLEAIVSKAFRLLEVVLQAKKIILANLPVGRVGSSHVTNLEQAIMSHTSSRDGVPFARRIAQYIQYMFSPADGPIPLLATRLLRLLCGVSIPSLSAERPPSLVAYLGQEADVIVSSFIRKLHSEPHEQFRIAIIDLASEALLHQPAFAEGFIRGETMSHQLELDEKDAPPKGLLEILHQLYSDRSSAGLKASAAHFLELLWREAPRHSVVISAVREGRDFWKNMMDLIEKLKEKNESSSSDCLDRCYDTLVIGKLMRLISLEVQTFICWSCCG